MSTHPDLVSAQITLRLVVTDGPDRPVHADLCYTPRDPYAVRVGFHAGATDVVEWTFARSLLADGVAAPVGDGDVKVWPANGERRGVCLSLSSPSGCALFETPVTGLLDFLGQTYRVVPPGAESRFVDVDSELADLLYPDS
jgi:hypothetical protein